MLAADGRAMAMEARLKGTVKWFNDTKGFGFISPDDGGEDLFVHQSSIKADGFRSLAEGEVVEFAISEGDDGRTKAVDVTGPDGSFALLPFRCPRILFPTVDALLFLDGSQVKF